MLGQRFGGCEGALERGALHGAQRQTAQGLGHLPGLLLAARIEVHATRPPREAPPDKVSFPMANEKDGGHEPPSGSPRWMTPRNHSALALGILFWLAKSTYTNPKRMLYPRAHSKLSISDQTK